MHHCSNAELDNTDCTMTEEVDAFVTASDSTKEEMHMLGGSVLRSTLARRR